MLKIKQEKIEDDSSFNSDQWLRDSVKTEEEDVKNELLTKNHDLKLEAVEDNNKQGLRKGEKQDEVYVYLSKGNLSDKQFWKDVMEKETVSKEVKSLCKYRCPKCGKIFQSKEALRHHLRRSKHAIESRTKLSNYLTKIVVHKCKICNERMLCDMKAIRSHIVQCHKIKIDKYIEMACDMREFLKSEGKRRKRDKPDSTFSSAPVSKEIGSLCRYKCQICNTIYGSSVGLHKHFRKTGHGNHSMSMLKECLIKTVTHKCHYCSVMVLCDMHILRSHVLTHGVRSLRDYMKTAGVNRSLNTLDTQERHKLLFKQNLPKTESEITRAIGNLCKFKCTKCEYTCPSWYKLKCHITSKGHGKISTMTNYVQKETYHKCCICDKVLLCDKLKIGRHVRIHGLTLGTYIKYPKVELGTEGLLIKYQNKLNSITKSIPALKTKNTFLTEAMLLPENQVTKHVGNICAFQCSFCSTSGMSCAWLHSHCKKKHQLKSISLKIENVTEARYHKCFVCARGILCDNNIIGSHVRVHKINFVKYIQDYVLKNGGKVIPRYQDYQRDNDVFESFNLDDEDKDGDNVNGLILPSMLSSESEDSD